MSAHEDEQMNRRKNAELRSRSGNVRLKSRLASFLYELMRDGSASVGEVERICRNSEDQPSQPEVASNGWLGSYSNDLSDRLVREVSEATQPLLLIHEWEIDLDRVPYAGDTVSADGPFRSPDDAFAVLGGRPDATGIVFVVLKGMMRHRVPFAIVVAGRFVAVQSGLFDPRTGPRPSREF